MEKKETILVAVQQYLQRFPDEQDETVPLQTFLHAHNGSALIDRKNFTGHITTSAFITNTTGSAVLLLKHKALNRWLQPGGHVDSTDESLVASALREACEETGLTKDDLPLVSESIFDIDSHYIPENPRKNEPAHVHHDIRFLFKCPDAAALNISLEESTGSKWVPFIEMAKNEDFFWLEEKIKGFRLFF